MLGGVFGMQRSCLRKVYFGGWVMIILLKFRKIVGFLLLRSTYNIQSLVCILDHDAAVDSLIHVDTNWWNIPLISEVFFAKEVGPFCGIYAYLPPKSNRYVGLVRN
jgi:hypothetical protein